MNIPSLYKKFIECQQSISTDTRMLEKDSLFFAWKGEVVDGNQYAQEAIDKGARYVVIDNPDYYIDDRTIVVPNTIVAFQDLARYHRRQFDIPVLAIGGSNGKTTTKDLITGILSTQKNVVASFASLNNHIGVPKTLLRMNNRTDIVVLEFGANHVGEIDILCRIAEPTHGIITNIGRDHIGYFGGQDAIIAANIELYNYLKHNRGYVFVNHNNMTLMKYASGIEQTCYAEGLNNEFGITSQGTTPYVSFDWKRNIVHTQLTGEYNLENIVAAIAIGVHFNIRDENIISAITSYVPKNNRSELLKTDKGNIVVKDFYNANLTSMKFALENLRDIAQDNASKKSIAIMGDMLELGEYSRGEHQSALDYARELGIDEIILIGPEFQATNHEGVELYSDVDAAIFTLQKLSFKDSIILLKASNGTNFKKFFNEISW